MVEDHTKMPDEIVTRRLPGGAAKVAEVERGDAVGRYVVLTKLGEGGMGVVWAAYDPELDRKVAVKLLRPLQGRPDAIEGRTRLLREAQAMAQLAHPNVATVHDVGQHRGAIYLAMEYVDGVTLRQWLEEGRPWRRFLDLMLDAGAGLAAAHDAGLVHRDFKPDNVMVGADGRVRVLDFGLARSDGERPVSASGAMESSSGALAVDLTAEGAVLGTPAYMSPEQFLGLATDERTDQFSFCVALWEGVYGERPFVGDTMAALMIAVTEGQLCGIRRDRREFPHGSWACCAGVCRLARPIVFRRCAPWPMRSPLDGGAPVA